VGHLGRFGAISAAVDMARPNDRAENHPVAMTTKTLSYYRAMLCSSGLRRGRLLCRIGRFRRLPLAPNTRRREQTGAWAMDRFEGGDQASGPSVSKGLLPAKAGITTQNKRLRLRNVSCRYAIIQDGRGRNAHIPSFTFFAHGCSDTKEEVP